MRKTILLAAAATAAAFAAVPASAQVSIINGSFEQGTNPGSFQQLNNGSTAITGWTVGPQSIDYIGSYWQASDGVRSIDLNGTSQGSISQQLTGLTVGRTYQVSFDLAGNPDGGSATKVAVASTAGSLARVYTFNTTGNTRDDMGWLGQTFRFTASGTTADLVFSSAQDGAFGAALDNVGISAVPEPATWAFMILGFGAVGGAMRRRKAQVAFA